MPAAAKNQSFFSSLHTQNDEYIHCEDLVVLHRDDLIAVWVARECI